MKLLRFLLIGSLCMSNAFAQLTSTNLPILIINGPSTISTTQVQGTLSIIDNVSGVNSPTDPPTFTGMIGINVRGNTSYPKSSYSVETWSTPTVSLDTAILGFPSENDWVLLSSYEDRSLLRNVLSLRSHDKMGRYAPRLKYCEVIINAQYMGIYTFGEKIKRDSNRVDISDLNTTDNAGPELTGGYIIRIDGNGDGWTSSIAPPYASTQQIKFEYEYPSANDITSPQMAYIKSYVDSFESALNGANFQDTLIGWRKFGAVNSFVDFFIMQEVTRNNEAYRKNIFLYKSKETKLRPGPLWNFDLALKNTSDCLSSVDTGWSFQYGASCGTDGKLPPFWWKRLTEDAQFIEDLACRYRDYRKSGGILDTVSMFAMIDSIRTKLKATNAITRNFTKWPIWGVPLVNEPLPMALTYDEEINNLKQFIKARLAWLDTKWIPTSSCPFPVAVSKVDKNPIFTMYPNPANNKLHVLTESIYSLNNQLEIISLTGEICLQKSIKGDNTEINISSLTKGMYLLKWQSKQGTQVRKFIKE